MSLPPELRVLCFQLSSTPPAELPRLTPTLLSHVLRCQIPLSSPAGSATSADAPASSVLVHKLKTQLSTLLNGKSSGGRFAAVVLIKAVVEIGGWEVLHGAESWVRGLLSVLGKPDADAVKELCIITLTKIYCMTHQYQTLVREITTPTLPTFVTSCLNLISSHSSKRAQGGPTSLEEAVFQSFAMLIHRHTTIYRPFTSQIRTVARPYLAPTSSDEIFVSSPLKDSARRLVVVLHQTAAKNASGEDWGRAVRELVRDIHVTADNVFRAVVEDWESAAGYIGEPVDVNQELAGDVTTAEGLPSWKGIHAGVERLTGRLELLAEYFKVETSAPVAIPIGIIMDMITRMLSIAIPLPSESAGNRGARLHPAIDRNERDGLWAGMPQIYVAALQLVNTISSRLEEGFLPIAQETFDQLAWVFQFGSHSSEFRVITYNVAATILLHIGQSLDRSQCAKLAIIIRSCCNDLQSAQPNFNNTGTVDGAGHMTQVSSQNTDAFLRSKVDVPIASSNRDTELEAAAGCLLPLLLSHLPQHYLDLSMRVLVERTAVLTHHKDAMVASILYPFVGKNGKAIPSLLPHLTRQFADDAVVEMLLRPRMPTVPSTGSRASLNDVVNEESENEDMDFHLQHTSVEQDPDPVSIPVHQDAFSAAAAQPGLSSVEAIVPPQPLHHNAQHSSFSTQNAPQLDPSVGSTFQEISSTAITQPYQKTSDVTDHPMLGDDSSSDDESVHLTMQLDTDSESEDGGS